MTDTPPTDHTERNDDPAIGDDGPTGFDNHATEDDGRDVRLLLERLALAGLLLLALVAGLRFYLAASTTIDRWIVREYRSLFHAAFNLALLLLAGYGISVLIGRLR